MPRDLVSSMKGGRVKVLLTRGADPMYGLPADVGFRDATYDVPFIFSFSGRMDDTTAMADLVLPSHSYLEDWGSDVPDPGPGHQVLGFQQPVVRPFFESRGTAFAPGEMIVVARPGTPEPVPQAGGGRT